MNSTDIDRGCRCWRRPSLAQSSCQRPDTAEDKECRVRTRTVRRRLLLVKVIARLQQKGVNCTSVQNPLTSLHEASEAARRAITAQPGPTVLSATPSPA